MEQEKLKQCKIFERTNGFYDVYVVDNIKYDNPVIYSTYKKAKSISLDFHEYLLEICDSYHIVGMFTTRSHNIYPLWVKIGYDSQSRAYTIVFLENYEKEN